MIGWMRSGRFPRSSLEVIGYLMQAGTILVVDDHPLMLDALRLLIRTLGTELAVATTFSAEAGLEKINGLHDLLLIIMDFSLPGLSGNAALSAFRKQAPKVPVIVVSGLDDRRIMEGVIKSGASAYISKTADPKKICETIRSVLLDRPRELEMPGDSITDREPFSNTLLTERQQEVLLFLIKGCSNKEIALRLKLAEATVKYHVKGIFRTLNVDNRTQAVIQAQKLMVPPLIEK